jgi:hypothetical protein
MYTLGFAVLAIVVGVSSSGTWILLVVSLLCLLMIAGIWRAVEAGREGRRWRRSHSI